MNYLDTTWNISDSFHSWITLILVVKGLIYLPYGCQTPLLFGKCQMSLMFYMHCYLQTFNKDYCVDKVLGCTTCNIHLPFVTFLILWPLSLAASSVSGY